MIRLALLALFASALVIGEAPASQRFPKPVILQVDDAKADCRTGKLERYPRYLAHGMRLSLAFRGPAEPKADASLLERVAADFELTNATANDSRAIFLIAQKQAGSRETADRLIRQACEIEQIPGFRLIAVQTTDAREIRRTEIEVAAQRVAAARADRIAERRRIAQEKRDRRALLRSPPTVAELTELLRNNWETAVAEEPRNPVTQGKFNRVRDVACKRQQGVFYCLVGVLGTSERGPEYEQLELEFTRDENGSVKLRETEVIMA